MQLELATSPRRGILRGSMGSLPMQDDPVEGRVAHDLRNILNIISGNLSLLARSVGEDPLARRHIDRAMAGVDLGTRLAGSVIGGRRAACAQSQTDLVAIRQSLVNVIGDAAGEGVAVEIDMPPTLPMMAVERTALENVLVNLAVNARHAMGGSGSLRISFENHWSAGRRMIRMSVMDTGCGMSNEVIDRIFDPYFTTKGDAGSGLGLASVSRFVEGCGGAVEVESTVGFGTAIRISMPTVRCGS